MVFWSLVGLLVGALPQNEPITLKEGLGITVPPGRRSAIRVDPIEALVVSGKWSPPKAGDAVDGRTWTKQTADANGNFEGAPARGGYFSFVVNADQARTALLTTLGGSMAYVNGAPRFGDPYSTGYVQLPIQLKAGANSILIATGRGSLQVSIATPKKPIEIDLRDSTVSDFLGAESQPQPMACVIRNATPNDLTDLTMECEFPGGKVIASPLGPILAMSCRKAGFQVNVDASGKAKLRLKRGSVVLDETDIQLRRRKAGESFRKTFLSDIDGSVQYFAVQPSTTRGIGQALILSLHGAGVEAMGQADAYAPKNWAHIVAPTNRRPFGFDWEDIGRLDALEVLTKAQNLLMTEPSRTYLTGHSMGGHGTWQLGAHFPNKFAAIGPSAGWISFFTYAGGASFPNPTPVEAMTLRASSPSSTLLLKNNYNAEAIYIVHGDADDNVPVAQARQMRQELAGHPNLKWHEQPGAGHWWDASDEPGADCVDWAPMFDLFATRRLPDVSELKSIAFTTVNPGINPTYGWGWINQQSDPFMPSSFDLKMDPFKRRVTGKTENIAELTLNLRGFEGKGEATISLDGQTLSLARTNEEETFVRSGGRWRQGSNPDWQKSPDRNGGFKDVFRRKFMLVYGTTGTDDENAWARNKARFDAESFWYRGNGSADVVSDKTYLAMGAPIDRNAVLYGNRDTNAALAKLVDTDKFDLSRERMRLGKDQYDEPLGVLCALPRKGSTRSTIGIVGGTSVVGCRLCDRAPLFVSGAGLPDLIAYRPESLVVGSKGIAVAGFFGNDWGVETGVWAKNER